MKKERLLMAAALLSLVSMASTYAIDDCGCRPKADRPVKLLTPGTGVVSANADLIGDVYFDCDTIYQLEARTYVQPGHSLTIEPGTIIWGRTLGTGNGASALIVPRDAKIYAVGKEDCPIVMTAMGDRDNGTQNLCLREQWGGLMVLGRAYNNIIASVNTLSGIANGLGSIEGIPTPEPRVYYGADLTGALGTVEAFDDNDNSGHIQYVSIRTGGYLLGTANEINGLTLGSVGRHTIVSHVEVVSNLDDAFEFFGGTVDVKFCIALTCTDDYFDWDQGYKGRGQFLLGVQAENKYLETSGQNLVMGDNGLEIDGHDNGSAALQPGQVMSNPKFKNVTILGNGYDSGIEAKENSWGEICNSIFANFAIGFNVYDDAAYPSDAYDNWMNNNLKLRGNTFVLTNEPCGSDAGATTRYDARVRVSSSSSRDLTTAERSHFEGDCSDGNGGNLVVSNANMGWDACVNFTCPFTVTSAFNLVPAAGVSLAHCASCDVEDDFFTLVNYSGAFEPGEEPWTKGWSSLEKRSIDWSVTPCPSDVNGDRQTGLSDLSTVASEFGQSCNPTSLPKK